MLKKILIATDGSKHSEEAARIGVELAKLSDGQATILHVVDVSGYIPMPFDGLNRPYAKEEAAALRNILLENGENAAIHAEKLARDSGITYEKMIVEGNPASEILKIAEESKKDIIVMGSIGKTGLEKFLLGSVAEKVVRNSKVPVLIIPPRRSKLGL